ncbi:enoyl-CoA hydratase [Croceicoccus sediminis]|uniref:enoyl-CoA hydratase n=1 Tax=Croceicoccus sediminis TaxID=2571150 RepID=UPI0011839BC4|nr:enoyl-CoA hydratase [Croceicoccus sediminis]
MTDHPTKITVESLDDGIVRIMLNSPENGNSQDIQMIYELDDALMSAARDRDTRVIILGGNGKHFSAGHDLRAGDFDSVGKDRPLTSNWGDVNPGTIEGWYGWEREVYFDMCHRWRSLPIPLITQVQGACIAGGLMLTWASDIVVCAENCFFQDPVVDIGIGGVEYFAHPWEMGSRQAKEKLFTGERWSAQEALTWGMVNRVVPPDELADVTLELARKIAAKPSVGIKFAKEAINSFADAQGFTTGVKQAFTLHHLAHAHNRLKYGRLIDPNGVHEAVKRSLPGGKLPRIPADTVDCD